MTKIKMRINDILRVMVAESAPNRIRTPDSIVWNKKEIVNASSKLWQARTDAVQTVKARMLETFGVEF